MLTLHNSLTKKKEIFVPIEPNQVRLYVCGMTVYDRCHLGHARMLVNFDVLFRWLKELGYHVTYVRNITDIDDKIIARAHANNESIQSLTERMIALMHQDLTALGVLPPTIEPKATLHIEGMIRLIGQLIDKKLAYVGNNADVYYSVRDFHDYGKLSGKSLEDLRSGERVAVDQYKRDPLDFVLWKAAKPGEPYWESPWGKGRPGWHIECSAMSEHYLGEHFDIHGGGHDLQFPHHENEIAQSEGAHGHAFVNVWLHNGFLRVNDEKMSKSLGNFFTIEEVLKVFHPEVVRFFLLRGHYRSPLNYTDQHLNDAKAALTTLYTALRGQQLHIPDSIDWHNDHARHFQEAMNDDLNTSEAVAVLFHLAREFNRTQESGYLILLKQLSSILGLLTQEPDHWLQQGNQGNDSDSYTDEQIIQAMDERKRARLEKNYQRSDEIRDELLAKGIILEDSPSGTSWRRQ
ncbi:MAG: cysteine--tRNA ligase [Ferrovum sp. 37-45-19]|jgi:cysteinyl-tRNA synthetase|uniref:cysteine--tRNA ligase n=1 Tax=Ferrovum sp. JA12 TaxID=1356299 RepID=UPI000703462E|nr:cysteine--tRNA ligase [Ferrovum sp. JA12]OYV80232.1 MAG: cysteine--tRNA ligase [Ferrovum sp. 21-44-67]OYV94509.1 MAG: cysteine--tRNA ligase [Ferrovum sp. 37-45-19]OZB33871.1 MAG: cysteine--tRNA ligase [Ferrovum sp. 34-44-207]